MKSMSAIFKVMRDLVENKSHSFIFITGIYLQFQDQHHFRFVFKGILEIEQFRVM